MENFSQDHLMSTIKLKHLNLKTTFCHLDKGVVEIPIKNKP